MQTKYFITNSVYRLEDGKVYRWSKRRMNWLHRDGFKPGDFTNGTMIGAVEVSELQALRRIVESMTEITE